MNKEGKIKFGTSTSGLDNDFSKGMYFSKRPNKIVKKIKVLF